MMRIGVAPIRIETNHYNDIRNALCHSALNIDIDFMFFNDMEKMCFILSEPELAYLSVKAMFEILHTQQFLTYN